MAQVVERPQRFSCLRLLRKGSLQTLDYVLRLVRAPSLHQDVPQCWLAQNREHSWPDGRHHGPHSGLQAESERM